MSVRSQQRPKRRSQRAPPLGLVGEEMAQSRKETASLTTQNVPNRNYTAGSAGGKVAGTRVPAARRDARRTRLRLKIVQITRRPSSPGAGQDSPENFTDTTRAAIGRPIQMRCRALKSGLSRFLLASYQTAPISWMAVTIASAAALFRSGVLACLNSSPSTFSGSRSAGRKAIPFKTAIWTTCGLLAKNW